MTFWEIIYSGEYVMLAMALLFVIIICIWWVRCADLKKQRKSYYPFMQRVRDYVLEGDLENARQLCEMTQTPGAKVVEAGLEHVGDSMTEVKSAMAEISSIEKAKLYKGSDWIRTIAVISPILGLGGTLSGIMQQLWELGEDPSTDVSIICAAISPTLATTIAGLGVGIFALIALTCVETSINTSKRKIDELNAGFIQLLNQPA